MTMRQCGLAVLCSILLASCQATELATGNIEYKTEFAGAIASDEPQATLAGKQILERGGNAVDAAIATAFTLSVTLPSRASLASGGACQIYRPDTGIAETIDFVTSSNSAYAPPAMPRALYALFAKGGKLRWQSLVSPAEHLAKFGYPISRAFAKDIALYEKSGGRKEILKYFVSKHGSLLKEGEFFKQIELASVLSRLRAKGPGDFYTGITAKQIVEEAVKKDFLLSMNEMKNYVPTWKKSIEIKSGNNSAFFPPEEISGKDISKLWAGLSDIKTKDKTKAIKAVDKLFYELKQQNKTNTSTGIVTADANGVTVACTLSMGKMFGTEKPLKNTGIIMAAPLKEKNRSIASMIIANNFVKELKFTGASTGKTAITDIISFASQAMFGGKDMPTAMQSIKKTSPDGGLVNAFKCDKGIPPYPETCSVEKDARGSGLAAMAGKLRF